jgi:hypothetical protein
MARDEASVGRIGVAQAARLAGVSRQAICNWIGAGWLRPAAAGGGGVEAADRARGRRARQPMKGLKEETVR